MVGRAKLAQGDLGTASCEPDRGLRQPSWRP